MDLFKDLYAAMEAEADNVAAEAQDEMRQVNPSENAPNYENTGDIFGLNGGGEEAPDDSGESDTSGGDESNADDLSDEDMGIGEDTTMSEDEENEAEKKMVIRDNLIELYTTIKGNLSQLSEYQYVTSADNSTHMSAVINNLTDLKSVISKTLTSGLKDMPYTTVLKKYLSIKKCYDICIKMLYEHFNNKDNSDITAKSKGK